MSGDPDLQGARSARIVVPGAIVERMIEPESPVALADALRRIGERRAGVLVVGGGTRLRCANPARDLALAISTRRLSGILEFEPEEGVLRAGAGTTLREIRAIVADEQWELPIDAPGEETTLGGSLASAANGPRGHAFGRVADAILGLEVAGVDGALTRCGGRVVKNVTGYDLAKLYCGSFGSLGVITSAWLRLRPRPARCRVFEAMAPHGPAGFEQCRAIASRASVRALVWQAGGSLAGRGDRLLVELAGGEAGLARDRAEIERGLGGVLEETASTTIDAVRDARVPRDDAGLRLRARVPGRRLVELVDLVSGLGLRVEVDLGLGALHARGELADVETLRRLRSQVEALGGFVVFEALPDALCGELDVFGDVGANVDLIRTLKQRFDPGSVLNPGRFVAGC